MHEEMKRDFGTHIVNGKTVTKDEVDAPLDVAILEVMAAVMVIQRVLVADDGAVVERCVVGGDAKRYCLHANSSWRRWRSGVLQNTNHAQFPSILEYIKS